MRSQIFQFGRYISDQQTLPNILTRDVSTQVNKTAIGNELRELSADVITVHHDEAVGDRTRIDLDKVGPTARKAYHSIAASIACIFH